MSENNQVARNNSQRRLGWIVLLSAAVVAGFIALNANKSDGDGNITNQEVSARVLGSLDDVLWIDADDEKPTVATVDNAEALRAANQEFYKNAQDGDYLILYPQRAIIYREDESKIINIAPIVNAGTDEPADETTEE